MTRITLARRTALLIAAIISISSILPVAGVACPSVQVVRRVEGAFFYADKAGSVVDPDAQRRNEELQAPIRKVLTYIETSLDASDKHSSATDCAFAILGNWAAGDALMEPPENFEGTVRRQLYSIGLNVIAVKFDQLGYAVTPRQRQWLQSIVDRAIDTYDHNKLRNNLYAWAGVAAASYALVTPYPRATEFENQVWRTSIAEITADGFLPKELTRAHRALIYHQYAFSALLMLRQMRLALGESESTSDRAALDRLAARISLSLCDPQAMAAASGAAQEMPDQTAYRVPYTFGDKLLDQNWVKCGITPPHYNDVNLGGRLDLTARALHAAAAEPRR